MLRGFWVALVLLLVSQSIVRAQLDPEKRRLIQLGYNHRIEKPGPIAGYGFFYYNNPDFIRTNLTLRLALAPIYVDSELGFERLLGPRTDLGLGLSGGGFADSYFEIRQGRFLDEESFTGHGGEISSSLYHLFNPDDLIPLWGILRGSVRRSFYSEDSDTDDRFEIPDDRLALTVRSGLRFGGKEPSLTEPLAMEASIWHESQFRTESGPYGFARDRALEPDSHLFWARALFNYIFGPSEQLIEASLTAGTSIQADRFSAYRLGGILPFVSEFPLSIPGYLYQEISAEQFALLNFQYSFPLEPRKNWRFHTYAAGGPVDYVDGLEQSDRWHAGLGAGVTYISPAGTWFVSLLYGHGFNALRDENQGGNQVGVLFQYDFEAKARGKSRWFIPGVDPYRSRGGERIFR